MNVQLEQSVLKSNSTIKITGSKSESNRVLLLQALLGNLELENISNSDDSVVMQKALREQSLEIDIHHAGTAMRFLTAYLSIQEGKITKIKGSSRMHERPIAILVDALRDLGATIDYLENVGFPPLCITGKELTQSVVSMKANVSSQYISALLLIGAFLPKGLTLNLEGKITSVPYIKMTLQLLEQVGVKTSFERNTITVVPYAATESNEVQKITVESDWSSASYFYSLIALSEVGTSVRLGAYKKDSLQGDACLSEIYKAFGVTTYFEENTIVLRKTEMRSVLQPILLDLSNAPDIAQTIAVTCYGLGIECNLKGLHTLKIKETDRLIALQVELSKLGALIEVTQDSLSLAKREKEIVSGVSIATYQDHRMAMAFAPLALKTDIIIEEAEVVSKSFPSFWDDLEGLGFRFSKYN